MTVHAILESFQPKTNWMGAFRDWFQNVFSNNNIVFFGRDRAQRDLERHVVKTVGSYGTQINCIANVLTVLLPRIDQSALLPQERIFVEEFRALAREADAAARTHQKKAPHGLTLMTVTDVVGETIELKGSPKLADQHAYAAAAAVLAEAVPAPRS